MKKIWVGIAALLGVLLASLITVMFIPGSYASASNVEYTQMFDADGIYIVYADECTHCIADEPEATKLIKENKEIMFKSINANMGSNPDMTVYNQPKEFLEGLGYVENGTSQESSAFYSNLAKHNIGQTQASDVFITGTPSYFAVKGGKVVGYESGAGNLSVIIDTYKNS